MRILCIILTLTLLITGLVSADLVGGATSHAAPAIIRLSPSASSGMHANWFRVHPDGHSVVFAVGTLTTTTALYRVSIGGGPLTTLQFTPTVTTTASQIFPIGISEATNRIVVQRYAFINPTFATDDGLYSIPLDGGAPISIAPSWGVGQGPLDSTLNSRGSHVVFRGRAPDTAPFGQFGLFSVRVDGSTPPRRLNPAPETGEVSIPKFWLQPNGQHVVYASPTPTFVNDIWSVPIDGPTTAAVRLNRALPEYSGGIRFEQAGITPCLPDCVAFTRDGQRVIFWASPDLVNVPVNGPETAGITLTAPLTSTANINFSLSADETSIAYLVTGGPVSTPPGIWSVPLTGPLSAARNVSPLSGPGSFAGLLASAGQRIIYQTGSPGQMVSLSELWTVPFAGPASDASRISIDAMTRYAVSPGGDWVIYSVEIAFGSRTWFAVPASGPPLARVLLGPALGRGSYEPRATTFTSDGTRVIMANGAGDLLSLPLKIGLTGAQTVIEPGLTVLGNSGQPPQISPGDRYVVYLARPLMGPDPNDWQLYAAELAPASPPSPTPTSIRILLPSLSK